MKFRYCSPGSDPVNCLPRPPGNFSYGKIKVVFSKITPGDSEKNFVPAYHFSIISKDETQVGHLSLRIGETRHILLAAGHLGYEIMPQYRGNRAAGDACLAIAPWAFTIISPILITADPDNLASLRTIQRIGAEFVDEVDVPKEDPHFQRGYFRKRRFLWSLPINSADDSSERKPPVV